MADYKSLFNPGGNRNPLEEVTDENNFALSPLASRPWDVPDLPERALTKEQIDAVLGLVNPKPEPLWGNLISRGEPADMEIPAPQEFSSSLKMPQSVPTSLEQAAPKEPVDFTDKEMKGALDAQEQKLRDIAGMRGWSQIARAIGGVSKDVNPFEDLEALAKLPAANIERKRQAEYSKFTKEKEMQDKKEAADPNSQHSTVYRNLAKSMLDMQGLTNISSAISGMSAEQIDKKFPMISNVVTAKMAQDSKKEMLALSKAEKADKQELKDEIRHQDWLANQLDKELKSNQFESINKLMQSSSNIDDALSNPSGIKDIGTLYNFIKSIDENSAVREGEVKLGREALSAMENLKVWSSNFSDKKRLLTPSIVKDIQILNEEAKKASSNSYMKRIDYVRNQGLDRGIDSDRLDRSLGVMVPEVKEIRKQMLEPKFSEAQERGIKRVMDDNKISREQAVKELRKAGKL